MLGSRFKIFVKSSWSLLLRRERLRLSILIVIGFFGAVLDLATVFSVIPFVFAVTADISMGLDRNIEFFGSELTLSVPNFDNETASFILVLFFLMATALRMIFYYFSSKLILDIEFSLSHRLFASYIRRSYLEFQSLDASVVRRNIFQEVSRMTSNVISPFITLITTSLMVGIIGVGLIGLAWNFLIPLLILGFLYFLGVSHLVKGKLISDGFKNLTSTKKMFTAVDIALNVFPLVKIWSLESRLLQSFHLNAVSYIDRQVFAQTISGLTKLLFDALLVAGIVVFFGASSETSDSFSNKLALIAALVGGFQRIFPLINQLFQAWNSLNYGSASSLEISAVMGGSSEAPASANVTDEPNMLDSSKIKLIRFNHCEFRYGADSSSTSEQFAVSVSDVEIRSGEMIAVTGPSGSGKSTFISLLTGLQEPSGGTVEYEYEKNHELKLASSCFSEISYMPQESILLRGTLLDNIVFDFENDDMRERKVDFDMLNKVSRLAQLYPFVGSAKDWFLVGVEDDGNNFSGGQRQRICVARTVYRNKQVIIFDESFNAIDFDTKNKMLNSIRAEFPSSILVMVTHDEKDISLCDYSLHFENGNCSKRDIF